MAATTTTKPVLPWKTRLSIFLLSALSDASRRSNDTINRSFFNFINRKLRPNSTPVDGVYTSDISVDPTRDLWFRLFVPSAETSAEELPVVLYFHGGGFSFMSPDSIPYDALCRSLSRSIPAIVISVNYRLTPEHRYPSQYDDGFDVLKFLDQNDTFPNADVTKCFLAGDSAGGNIIHHVAVRVCKEKLERVKVLGLISIQPFFGGEERTESEIRLTQVPLVSVERCDWHWKVFLPNGSNRDHGAANVMGPNAVDISGLDYPNTLVLVAGFDPLQDWQRRYYEWLRKSGKKAQLIEYPNTIHAFYVFPELPEGSQFISQVKDFVTEQVSNVN